MEMNKPPEDVPTAIRNQPLVEPSANAGSATRSHGQQRRFPLATAGLALCFALPLAQLIRFAATSGLFSYILLIPFISLYLFWQRRSTLTESPPDFRIGAWMFLVAGLSLLAVHWLGLTARLGMSSNDKLTIYALSCVLCFYAVCCWFWGKATLRTVAFPLGFLIFIVPIPSTALPAIDAFLQKGSALAAAGFFTLAGTAYFQDGLVFQLPNITLQIAPECSGIRSTLVLFITSLLAGQLLLQTTWKRVVLVLFIIPLGIIRNGFRVFVIGELCVHVGPHMIDSPIHHRGGPIFFLLSLIPLVILLMILRKSEKNRNADTTQD
jgi:exosortase C (VPDSG-CTERM-specific)